MRRVPLLLFAVALGSTLTACSAESESDRTPATTPAEDTVSAALALYDAAAFDSISWDTNDDAVVRGSVVFSFSCKKCHGNYGEGDGGFVTRGDTLVPPAFNAEDWRFRSDLAGLRQQVFIGTTDGMPHWGLENLKVRDIDAVARFIQDRLVHEAPGA